MGQRQKLRHQHSILNTDELMKLAQSQGVEVTEFVHGSHYRLHGERDVDYWPSTSRAWPVGGNEAARRVTPGEVVQWARTGIQP